MAQLYTRSQYLIRYYFSRGASLSESRASVDQTALAHPELDMDEERTWEGWKRDGCS